jgi:LRR receptor-like serine/threonine-protein kinase FLS2
MPNEFGQFPLVKSVEFSDNSNLEGSIPTTIGLLTNLEIFSIENSNVAGAIPAEIGGATSLVEIRAANNRKSSKTACSIISSILFLLTDCYSILHQN